MSIAVHPDDIQSLKSAVSRLNAEIEAFYDTYGNNVRVTGHCNFRNDLDEPYFRVNVEVTEIIAKFS